jgi:hypothetical protein
MIFYQIMAKILETTLIFKVYFYIKNKKLDINTQFNLSIM